MRSTGLGAETDVKLATVVPAWGYVRRLSDCQRWRTCRKNELSSDWASPPTYQCWAAGNWTSHPPGSIWEKKTAFTSQDMKEISYLNEQGSTKLLVYLNKTNVTYHDNIPTDHQADVFGESPHKVHQSGTNVWRTGQNETLRPKRAFICERLVYRELKRSVC